MARRDPNALGFFEHLEELRGRIFKSLLIWVVLFAICFAYHELVFQVLAGPIIAMTETEYVFAAIDIKEPFIANIKAAFWVSFIFSSGIFFYHFWSFIAPGLNKKEKRFAIPFLIFMAMFFVGGCLFSFFAVYPIALDYLIGWNDTGLHAYTRSSYLSLLFTFVLAMGISFELPLVIFFLAKIGIVTPKFLLSKFKYAVVLIFTAAALITPTPDIYLQTFLAGPMLLLYLLGVGVAYLVKRDKEEESVALEQEWAQSSQEDEKPEEAKPEEAKPEDSG